MLRKYRRKSKKIQVKSFIMVISPLIMLDFTPSFADTKDLAPPPIYHQRQAEFRPWSQADLHQAEALFTELFETLIIDAGSVEHQESRPDKSAQHAPEQHLQQQLHTRPAWQTLGMSLSTISLDTGETVLLLAPKSDRRQGSGYYLFRSELLSGGQSKNGPEVMLQAPHQFHDKGTGHIALSLFSEHPVRALVLNSAHRKRVDNRRSLSTNPDLAHNAHTLLMAFTRGFIAVQAQGRVVQLHGFNAKKRKTAAGRSALTIVSGGTNWPTEFSTTAAACLAREQARVLLYPQEVTELGGTTNSTANWLAMNGSNHFLHLENSVKMRENLLNNPRVRSLFWSCISKSGRNVEGKGVNAEKFGRENTPTVPDYDSWLLLDGFCSSSFSLTPSMPLP